MRHKSEELMKQIMDYAEQFQLLNHRSPYTSEIADALGIVKSTVYKYLVAMNDRGMLSYRNGEIVTERTNKNISTYEAGGSTWVSILWYAAAGGRVY